MGAETPRRGPRPGLDQRVRLIVITDASLAAPRSVVDVVRAAVAAGAPCIQLRAKGASARELMEMGHALLPVTSKAGALLFVNDRLDVALALGADGVHVGPHDIPVAAVRHASGPRLLIGASCDEPDEARRLVAAGADYIGCGTVYPTSTKADAGTAIGLARLGRVAAAVTVPVVGIGGITANRAPEIRATGASGCAAVGAIMAAPDVAATVDAFLRPWS